MKTKNFGLSEEEFIELCENLRQGKEELFEKIFLSHFADCISYLRSKFNTNHESAYDASMDTMLEFRRYLINDKIKYGNLRFLFTKMASQRWMKLNKKAAKVTTIDQVPEMMEFIQHYDDEELEILNKAWAKMTEECQKLLKQFYYDNLKLSVIANNIAKTPGSVRKQKERCVNTLRNNFQAYIK